MRVGMVLTRTIGQGLTLVPISAQLELTLPLFAQLKLTVSPVCPRLTRECVPKVLKLCPNVSDVFPKVLKLSSDVSECKPLPSAPRCSSCRRTPTRRPCPSLHRFRNRFTGFAAPAQVVTSTPPLPSADSASSKPPPPPGVERTRRRACGRE